MFLLVALSIIASKFARFDSLDRFDDPIQNTQFFVFAIFVLYPQLVLVTALSIIFLKYFLNLSQISNHLELEEAVNLQGIFEQYEKLYKEFKMDYSTLLYYAVGTFYMAEVLYIWNIAGFADFRTYRKQPWREIIDFIRTVLLLLLPVLTASLLSECHQRFQEILWSQGSNTCSRRTMRTTRRATTTCCTMYKSIG